MALTPTSYTRFQTSVPSTRSNRLVQPFRRKPVSSDHPATHNLFSLPNEPEDARLTGGTRSLDRRLLALNVAGSLGKRGPISQRIAPDAHPAVA